MANPFTGTAAAFSPIDYLAPDVAESQRQLQRQQAMVDLLRQRALEDDSQTQMVSGWAIPNSGVKPFEKLANALMAGKMQQGVDAKQSEIAKRYAEALTGGTTGTGTSAGGSTPSLRQIMLYKAMGIDIPPEVAKRMMGIDPNKEIVKVDAGDSVQVLAIDPVTGAQTVVQTVPKGVSPDTQANNTTRVNEGVADRNVTMRGQNMTSSSAAAGRLIDAARLGKPEYVTGPNGAVIAMPGVSVPGYSGVPAGMPAAPMPGTASPGAAVPSAVPAAVPATVPSAASAAVPGVVPGQPVAVPGVGTVVVPGKTVAEKAAEGAAIKGAEATATAAAEGQQKREGPAFGVKEVIAQARGLLKGVDVRATANNNGQPVEVATPTHSVIGSVLDWGASLIGAAPDSADTAERLRVLSGKLIQSVPRFEGNQSDADRASYELLAGRVGDSSIPISRRLAALDEVENMIARFDRSQPAGASGGWSIRPVGK